MNAKVDCLHWWFPEKSVKGLHTALTRLKVRLLYRRGRWFLVPPLMSPLAVIHFPVLPDTVYSPPMNGGQVPFCITLCSTGVFPVSEHGHVCGCDPCALCLCWASRWTPAIPVSVSGHGPVLMGEAPALGTWASEPCLYILIYSYIFFKNILRARKIYLRLVIEI